MSTPVLVSLPLPIRLTPRSFTPDSFAPYGTAIVPPLPHDLVRGPPPSLPPHTPAPVLANQSSALKYSPISPLDNYYPDRSPSGEPSSARMSLFACFPRDLRRTAGGSETTATTALFDVCILERHPYTTQTFIPLNSTSRGQQNQAVDVDHDDLYLVIVAPSRKGETATASVSDNATGEPKTVTISDPPDLNKVEAFVARKGQAVTYAAGTWHAPMVVMGQRRVDFVVVQFANGVGDEDCQEVAFGKGIEVEVKDDSEGLAKL